MEVCALEQDTDMPDSQGLQHVNVKFFLNNADALNLEDAINVFHSWIQQQSLDDLLIDVADYRHVPSGPGVILVGHNAHYALDHAEGRWGVLYNRKTAIEADAVAQIEKAIAVGLDVCRKLAAEQAFQGKIDVVTDSMQVVINDRLLGENSDQGFQNLVPHIKAALSKAFGEQDYQLEPVSDRRKRLTVNVRIPQGFNV